MEAPTLGSSEPPGTCWSPRQPWNYQDLVCEICRTEMRTEKQSVSWNRLVRRNATHSLLRRCIHRIARAPISRHSQTTHKPFLGIVPMQKSHRSQKCFGWIDFLKYIGTTKGAFPTKDISSQTLFHLPQIGWTCSAKTLNELSNINLQSFSVCPGF